MTKLKLERWWLKVKGENISKDENVRNVDQILTRVPGKGDGSH